MKEDVGYPLLKKGQTYVITKIDRDYTGQRIYRLVSDDDPSVYVGWIEQYLGRYDEKHDLDNDIEAIKEINNNCYFMSLVEFREERLSKLL